MQSLSLASLFTGLLLSTPVVAGDMAIPERLEKGTVRFSPRDDQKNIPSRYRLDSHTFEYELSQRLDLPNNDLNVHHLQFPSPVKTDAEENNTVHGEYYRPHGDGPFPGVIVLDIIGGDGNVSRMVATTLAQTQIAALALRMPW